ncbi:hypothetical protein V5799_031980 [Amblyomma americanum]|uniref:Uncharacterized protein n=1 Tax=Amblyomma americanum TaxID=6943 RepID=A0AAQ4DSG9_AMBAM
MRDVALECRRIERQANGRAVRRLPACSSGKARARGTAESANMHAVSISSCDQEVARSTCSSHGPDSQLIVSFSFQAIA